MWMFLALAIILFLSIGLGFYRRQVKKICRQLKFINQNDTNLLLSEDCFFTELNCLNEEINALIKQKKQISRDTKQKEEIFRDTITNISHDIRTPLTSLDGYFQLLVQSSSEEERERYLSVIKERITSLNDMLEELFTYTKLQNDEYELDMGIVDFGKQVYDTVFSFYEDFQGKQMEPLIDFSEERYFILGNQEAVRRILQNMIKNALVHGKSNIMLKLFHEKGKVIFECANDLDTGDEIDLKQIFVRFYKADLARTQSSAGLGLSIVKGLAEKMGGTVEAGIEEDIFCIRVCFKREENYDG